MRIELPALVQDEGERTSRSRSRRANFTRLVLSKNFHQVDVVVRLALVLHRFATTLSFARSSARSSPFLLLRARPRQPQWRWAELYSPRGFKPSRGLSQTVAGATIWIKILHT